MLSKKDFEAILAEVQFNDWAFFVGERRTVSGDLLDQYLQVRAKGTCNVTGAALTWHGRKWFLSQHMTKSEVVQTAFKAVLTALEHEARERFKYRGRSIFDPHYNIDRLWGLRGEADALDRRSAA